MIKKKLTKLNYLLKGCADLKVYIVEHGTKDNRLCTITGLSISMQKDSSLLLSHTGLKHYFQHDKNIFEQIKRKYLSDKWRYSDLDTQIKEIAHNIRNTLSNQNIKQRRIYPIGQTNLLNQLNN